MISWGILVWAAHVKFADIEFGEQLSFLPPLVTKYGVGSSHFLHAMTDPQAK